MGNKLNEEHTRQRKSTEMRVGISDETMKSYRTCHSAFYIWCTQQATLVPKFLVCFNSCSGSWGSDFSSLACQDCWGEKGSRAVEQKVAASATKVSNFGQVSKPGIRVTGLKNVKARFFSGFENKIFYNNKPNIIVKITTICIFTLYFITELLTKHLFL